MKQPRFSIIIPTRNRAETLRYALATYVAQDFDDYEILVCDNGDSSAAREVVDAANSLRIRYLHTDRTLAMSANWEWGVSEARGVYVTVLGDDDGLMPYALRELDLLISRTGMQVIHWHRGIYTWPTIGVDGEANLLRLPLSRTITEIDGREQIGKVIRFEVGADSLPMIYCSVIHRALIDEHRRVAGRVFLNIYPDVYSSFGFGYLAGKYLSVSVPMNIAGLSHASNGVATLMKGKRSAIANEFERLNTAFGYRSHPRVPDDISLLPVHVADCFLHAKDALFPTDDTLVLDRKSITERYLGAIVETDPEARVAARQSIRRSVADDLELSHWFDSAAPSPPPALAFSFRPQRLGFDGSVLILDAAAHDVENVAGAVKLADSLLGFGSREIPYDVPSTTDVQLQVLAAQQRAARSEFDAAVRLEQYGYQVAELSAQLEAAHAARARLEEQVHEAYRAGALRHVPKRVSRKVLGMARRLIGSN